MGDEVDAIAERRELSEPGVERKAFRGVAVFPRVERVEYCEHVRVALVASSTFGFPVGGHEPTACKLVAAVGSHGHWACGRPPPPATPGCRKTQESTGSRAKRD